MEITIENSTVVVNLDESEFPIFEVMFANLEDKKTVKCEFREFNGLSGSADINLLPMHLCRTIGEANLAEDPFATITLYPFWKYGFAFGGSEGLVLNPSQDDPHKKAVVADEMGMGFCAWAMEEVFGCETWADASALIAEGYVAASGGRTPDFVCTFPDGSLGIFEAKGTTGTTGDLTSALASGKLQAACLTALAPIKYRVVVGVALNGGAKPTKVIMLDPPASTPLGDREAEPTNLTANMVKAAARKMRTPSAFGISLVHGGEKEEVTIFRAPGMEIRLKREKYREDKRHGWLDLLK